MKVNGKAQPVCVPRTGRRIELGRYIVADPNICHGKPTYKGTRIMVWQILEALAHGESVDELVRAWGRRVSRDAVLETIQLSQHALLNRHGKLRSRRLKPLAVA